MIVDEMKAIKRSTERQRDCVNRWASKNTVNILRVFGSEN